MITRESGRAEERMIAAGREEKGGGESLEEEPSPPEIHF